MASWRHCRLLLETFKPTKDTMAMRGRGMEDSTVDEGNLQVDDSQV